MVFFFSIQKTPSGNRKIIDVIDCSGCGDVDTSTCVAINTEDKTIDGITGRKLKVKIHQNSFSLFYSFFVIQEDLCNKFYHKVLYVLIIYPV